MNAGYEMNKKMLKTINRIKSNEVKWNTFLQMFALFLYFQSSLLYFTFFIFKFLRNKIQKKKQKKPK